MYRLWNQRADSNHRYTTDPATKALMIAKGYIPEGYGPDAVVMCTPGAAKGDTTARVTGFSPLAPGCDGEAPSGVLYSGAEVEPMVAVDPANSQHLIGVWQQDRWSSGGAAGQLAGVSFDGGRTWSEVTGRTGKGWLALLGELWSKDAGYPLYHLLLKVWVTVAGDSEWALRFPSALAGAAAVTVLYYAALELGRGTKRERSPYHAIVAALLFALSPFALWYAQDAKAYSLLMLAVASQRWYAAMLYCMNSRMAKSRSLSTAAWSRLGA